MYVKELVYKKEVIDIKIKELEKIIRYNTDDSTADRLWELLSDRQSILININKANSESKIIVGGMEISIFIAVEIRKTMEKKIKILTEIIEDKDCSLDKLELIDQRDKVFDEHALLSMGILQSDLKVSVMVKE